MKRFGQTMMRFRLVLAIVSIAALVITFWLQRASLSGNAAATPAEMPAQPAVTLQDKLTEASQGKRVFAISPEITAEALPEDTPQKPTTPPDSSTVTINPHATVKDAMTAPTSQTGSVSTLSEASPAFWNDQSILNGMTKQPARQSGK